MKTCNCGQNFVSFVPGQLRCPTCADIKYRAPSIVLSHEVIWERTVTLGFQPEWEPAGDLRNAGFKYSEKGSQFGANWAGRFDLHAPMTAWQQGASVLLRHMWSHHLVRVEQLPRNNYIRRVPIAQGVARETVRQWVEMASNVAISEGGAHPWNERARVFGRVQLTDGTYLKIETRPYYVLWPATEPASGTLVRIESGYKYTLKGFGAQWKIQTVWPVDTVIIETVSGGYRSGRRKWNVEYAIVPENSMIMQHRSYISGSGKHSFHTRTVWPEQTEWVEEE